MEIKAGNGNTNKTIIATNPERIFEDLSASNPTKSDPMNDVLLLEIA